MSLRNSDTGSGEPRLWRLDPWGVVATIVVAAAWAWAFPAERTLESVDIAMEASYLLAVALGYPVIAALGDRLLSTAWLVFMLSLVIEVLDEFTIEPRFWNETFPFLLGLAGLAGIGSGVLRFARRRERELRERQQAIAEIEHSHSMLEAVVEGTPDLVAVRDLEGRYLLVNSAVARAAGRRPEDMIGRTNAELYPPEVAAAQTEKDARVLETGEPVTYEETIQVGQRSRTYLVTKAVYRDRRGFALGVLHQSRDISDRKKVEEQLAHDAVHDGLTGLPNRVRFLEELGLSMSRQRRRPEHLFAVLFLDLDRFKVINDSLGHSAGDELLAAFGRTLRAWLRPTDVVARMGGDEFTVLLDGMDHADDATRVAERIAAGLRQPLKVGQREIFVSVSIGIAHSTTGYDRPDDVLRDADLALYRAKGAGRGRYAVFDVAMHERAMAHLQLETDLRRAVERGEFRIAYQPIVAVGTRRLVGFEALIRWQHPQRGLLGPSEFLEVADETGLMVPIGTWVLREACGQLAQWQARFPDAAALTMSCNVSSRQLLHPQLVQTVREALDGSGLAPVRLRIEVTESVIMEHAEAAIQRLRELRDLGVQLDMDDFGTGYSSLSHLQRFPLQAVKIDRSFVDRMRGGENAEIVKAILTLGRNLGLEVIAEGVETGEQHDALVAMGCPQAQGYLFSHPVLSEEAERLLAQAEVTK